MSLRELSLVGRDRGRRGLGWVVGLGKAAVRRQVKGGNGLGRLLGTAFGITMLLTSVDPEGPGHPGSRFLQPGTPWKH